MATTRGALTMPARPRFLPAGDARCVVEYRRRHRRAGQRARARRSTRPSRRRRLRGIVETVPTYRSLMVALRSRWLDAPRSERGDRGASASTLDESTLPQPRTVEIPTLYGGEFGPDLADVAAHAGLTDEEVVSNPRRRRSTCVFMMGFMPGFPYLGGMSPRIATPRLADAAHRRAGRVGRHRRQRRPASIRPRARAAGG